MPLERRSPMRAGRPLQRGSGPARTGPIARKIPAARPARAHRPAPRPQRRTGPGTDVRTAVLTRDHGLCVVCGGYRAENVHHRRNRGMGGRAAGEATAAINQMSNLLSVCGSGTTGCHGWITTHPADAAVRGLVLSTNSRVDPATIAVRTFDGWWLYDNDGGRVRCDPPEGAPQ